MVDARRQLSDGLIADFSQSELGELYLYQGLDDEAPGRVDKQAYAEYLVSESYLIGALEKLVERVRREREARQWPDWTEVEAAFKGITNWLFIIAADTNGLRYCENDAQLMQRCFGETYGFEVIRPAQLTSDGVERAFTGLRDQASRQSTLLVYFSGHTTVDSDDLRFVLNEENRAGSKLKVSRVLEDLARTPGKLKLAILDCGYTVKAVQNWHYDESDSYYVLAASSGELDHSRAKQFDRYQASFLTHRLTSGLQFHYPELSDPAGRVTLGALFQWLKDGADEHNRASEDNRLVPRPKLMGASDQGTVLLGMPNEALLWQMMETVDRSGFAHLDTLLGDATDESRPAREAALRMAAKMDWTFEVERRLCLTSKGKDALRAKGS